MPVSRRNVLAFAASVPLAAASGFALASPATAGPLDFLSPGGDPRGAEPKLSDYSPPVSDDEVTVTPVEYQVTNFLEPGSQYTVRGFLYEPARAPGCRSSILLANHALTTGAWYWDIPFEQQKYSIARKVARNGIPFLALNKLGYGLPNHPFRSSDKPNGSLITVQVLADVSHQVTQQLRGAGYQHVGLIGHSAGSEESEIQAGVYRDVDALILSGFTHLATPRFTAQIAAKDSPEALTSEYNYFFQTEENRDSFLFTPGLVDPALVEALHPLVNDTPAGEVLSIGPQPSQLTAAVIDIPVLTLIAEGDQIFDAAGAARDEAMLVGTDDKTFIRYPGIGHGVEFHSNGPEITQDVVDWLLARPDAMPAC